MKKLTLAAVAAAAVTAFAYAPKKRQFLREQDGRYSGG